MNHGSNLILGSQYSREGLNTGRSVILSDGFYNRSSIGTISPGAPRGLYPSIP
jgi:hypothetical protein